MSKKFLLIIAVLSITGCTLQDEPYQVETFLEIHGSMLIGTPEYLYVSSGITRCIDWDGNIIWETETLWGSEMIYLGDSLFLRAFDRPRMVANVRLLDLNGRILWQKDIGETTTGGLGASDNLLVAGSMQEDETGILWAFSKTGDVLWTYDHAARIDEIVVAPDGSCVIFTDYYGFINCVENSNLIWSKSIRGSSMVGSAAFDTGDQALAFAPDSSYAVYGYEKDESGVEASTPQGAHLWRYPLENRPRAAAITHDSQYIMVGTFEYVYKFTRNGTLVWATELPGTIANIAVTPDGGYIATGSDLPSFFTVLTGDGTILWKTKSQNNIYAVTISSDGAFAAYSRKGEYVYLFHNPPQSKSISYQAYPKVI